MTAEAYKYFQETLINLPPFTFDNYKDGEFTNVEETVMITGEMPRGEFFKEVSGLRPDKDFSPDKIDFNEFKKSDNKSIKFAWIGHSAFLFNISGKLIMLDPMLGNHCAPVPIPSLKRYQEEIALSIDDIDSIDVIKFSSGVIIVSPFLFFLFYTNHINYNLLKF